MDKKVTKYATKIWFLRNKQTYTLQYKLLLTIQ